MSVRKRIIVGTRGSQLALAQTDWVISSLKKKFPQYEFIIRKITTQGDRVGDWSLIRQDKGIFVKEIEDALLGEEIDVAIHSMKDMPTDLPPGLRLVAVTSRLNPQDILISKNGIRLVSLKKKTVVGTSSLRRRAQLLHWRKDLIIKELRGNLDTRIKKLNKGEFDAIIVAASGIIRMGWESLISEYIPSEILLPAAGQGALGIEARQSDKVVGGVVKILNHRPSRNCIMAERAFLKQLGGGCRVPIGALANISDGQLTLEGAIASLDGKTMVRLKDCLKTKEAEVLGKRLAVKLLKMGGAKILEEIKVR